MDNLAKLFGSQQKIRLMRLFLMHMDTAFEIDELKTKTTNLFPQNNALTLRLQAFGVDAFRLYPRLRQLEDIPDSQIYGATGLLKLGDNRNIIWELNWAKVSEGLARVEAEGL